MTDDHRAELLETVDDFAHYQLHQLWIVLQSLANDGWESEWVSVIPQGSQLILAIDLEAIPGRSRPEDGFAAFFSIVKACERLPGHPPSIHYQNIVVHCTVHHGGIGFLRQLTFMAHNG